MGTWRSPKKYAAAVLALDARVQALQPSWSSTREASDCLAVVNQLLLELRKVSQDVMADTAVVQQISDRHQDSYGGLGKWMRSITTSQRRIEEYKQTLAHYGTLKSHLDQTLKSVEKQRGALRTYLNQQKKRNRKAKKVPAPPHSFAPQSPAPDEDVAAWWDFAKTAVVTDHTQTVAVCAFCSGRLEPEQGTCPSCGEPVSSVLRS